MGETGNVYKIFIRKSEGKTPPERAMCNRVILKWFLNWIHLAQNRDQLYALVNMAMKFWFP
jgi:hypothetical protein